MSIDPWCPDCWKPPPSGYGFVYKPCGLSNAEHKRMRKLRAQAEKQAHQLAVEARERELLPRALIKEVYDQAEQDVRLQLGR
jgi:hypothetical protein